MLVSVQRLQPEPTGPDRVDHRLEARGGVAAGLISIPNRYMHSAVEMISLDDIDEAADLLAQFALAIEKDADFTPK